MVHPDTEIRYLNPALGFGLVANRPIPRGTIIWALDSLDQVFPPERVGTMSPWELEMIEKWGYSTPDGSAILNWDGARFFNHSCDPSCMNAGMNFEIAVRDIQPGEELTDDYSMLNKKLPGPCACGSLRCRRVIREDDLLRHADRWDAIVRTAFPAIADVPQPLWDWVKEKTEIARGLQDPARIPSCRANYFPRSSPPA